MRRMLPVAVLLAASAVAVTAVTSPAPLPAGEDAAPAPAAGQPVAPAASPSTGTWAGTGTWVSAVVAAPRQGTGLLRGAATAPARVASPSSVGKLIWERTDGQLGMCSGATVAAANGSVVATAAHCAAEASGHGNRAWYLPGYRDGLSTFRQDGWPVAAFHLPEAWDDSAEARANLPHDYAFLTVQRKRGRTVEQQHGANRLLLEPVPEEHTVTAIGYPAAPPYDGEQPYACSGPSRVLGPDEAASFNVGGLLLEDCEMTRGASGGPWLQDYDPESQSGVLVGVTSVGTGEGEILGRPFPAAARDLYDLAAAGPGG